MYGRSCTLSRSRLRAGESLQLTVVMESAVYLLCSCCARHQLAVQRLHAPRRGPTLDTIPSATDKLLSPDCFKHVTLPNNWGAAPSMLFDLHALLSVPLKSIEGKGVTCCDSRSTSTGAVCSRDATALYGFRGVRHTWLTPEGTVTLTTCSHICLRMARQWIGSDGRSR